MKPLSSGLTFIYQFVYPLAFLLFTVVIFLTLMHGGMTGRSGQPPPAIAKWLVLIGGGLSTAWAIAQAMMIRYVCIDQDKLKVSGLWCGDAIGFESVESIRETRFRNPKLVIVRLKTKFRCGKTVRFIPRGKGVLFGTHPIVSVLIGRVRRAAIHE